MNRTIRIATRQSPLALWQARHAARLLRIRWPGLRTTLVTLTSSGDQDTETPLYGMGNIGVFSKEVHLAVLTAKADIAVHSCKDLPTTVAEGMAAPIMLRRHDPRDALIGVRSLDELPEGALIGSSSLRRRAQLAALRPDLQFDNIRGNVATRMRQVAEGTYAATVLACAGLQRLGVRPEIGMAALDPSEECIPAVAQGAIAVDCRADDRWCQQLVRAIGHRRSQLAVITERKVLSGLRGGCSLPLGCHVQSRGTHWLLQAALQTDDGLKRIKLTGPRHDLAERALAALVD